MANFKKISVGNDARTELYDAIGLTGAEISVNNFPAGAGVPFVHAHKNNEEIYFVVDGRGEAMLDGEKVALEKGDWVRVSPATQRQFSAAPDCGISLVCIQVKENSLEGYTADDAIMC